MSESFIHKTLVRTLMDDIQACTWDPPPFVYGDLNGAALPPLIGRARPDMYAHHSLEDVTIIGEAKTSSDLDSFHTIRQFEEYFDYLKSKARGELWLAVPWLSAGAGIRICELVKKRSNSTVAYRVSGWMIGERTFSKVWYG